MKCKMRLLALAGFLAICFISSNCLAESTDEEIVPLEIPSNGQALVKGIYMVGADIDPGSYVIELTGFDYTSTIATFLTQDDLSSYTSWTSPNNLKEYSKIALEAKANEQCHLTLDAGDYFYVAQGSGYIAPADPDTIMKGVYIVGKDIEAGSYIITLSDIENSAVVATFASAFDLVSYITWDSESNLEEFSQSSLRVKDGEQFHISLSDGDILFI